MKIEDAKNIIVDSLSAAKGNLQNLRRVSERMEIELDKAIIKRDPMGVPNLAGEIARFTRSIEFYSAKSYGVAETIKLSEKRKKIKKGKS